jgi:hypothetical protein
LAFGRATFKKLTFSQLAFGWLTFHHVTTGNGITDPRGEKRCFEGNNTITSCPCQENLRVFVHDLLLQTCNCRAVTKRRPSLSKLHAHLQQNESLDQLIVDVVFDLFDLKSEAKFGHYTIN